MNVVQIRSHLLQQQLEVALAAFSVPFVIGTGAPRASYFILMSARGCRVMDHVLDLGLDCEKQTHDASCTLHKLLPKNSYVIAVHIGCQWR